MNNFKTAAEIRDIANAAKTETLNNELINIYNFINEAANKGLNDIKCESISEYAQEFLKNKLFNIKYFSSQKDFESYYIISW